MQTKNSKNDCYKEQLNTIVPALLSQIDKQILFILIKHLRAVSQNKANMMGPQAIAICWGPSYIRAPDMQDLMFRAEPSAVFQMLLEDLDLDNLR